MRGTRPLTRPEFLQGHRRHAPLARLEEGPTDEPPPAPQELTAGAASTWERLWQSKLSGAWSRETDLAALTRYVLNLDKWLQYEAMVARVPMMKGSKGQLRPNPLAARMDALEGQLRYTEEQYGLTPASRIRLGLEIVERRPSVLDEFLRQMNGAADGNHVIDLDELSDDPDPRQFRAAHHLGWLEVPAILVDIPEQLAKERAMRDNAQWGEWEEDDLVKLLGELKAPAVT